jgi:hypothetical protein
MQSAYSTDFLDSHNMLSSLTDIRPDAFPGFQTICPFQDTRRPITLRWQFRISSKYHCSFRADVIQPASVTSDPTQPTINPHWTVLQTFVARSSDQPALLRPAPWSHRCLLAWTIDRRTASDSLECPPTSETSIGVSCGKYVVAPGFP